MCKGNVLVIGDTHIPFEHPGYLDFCKAVEKEFSCNKVVHVGDLIDNHSINFHDKIGVMIVRWMTTLIGSNLLRTDSSACEVTSVKEVSAT